MQRAIKRAIDFIAAGTALILLAPVLAVVALAIRIGMGAPVLFRHMRPGRDEKIFTLYKFRTMREDRGADGKLLPNAERLTRLGRFLRTTSLDELPQLWNIIRGDMSLVGPRPLLPAYLDIYSDVQRRRHAVRPGVTGWAQVNGRNELTWDEKIELDVRYVDSWSLLLDARILARTIPMLLMRRGVGKGGRATTGLFDPERHNHPDEADAEVRAPEPLAPYRKDPSVEENLDRLNRLLEPLDREIADAHAAPALPTVFVLGTPRSGHTLAAQYLIDRYALAYPSNFIARFWRAPVLGARLQRIALDQAVGGGRPRESFESEHGLTSGSYGLHEFGYFWTDVFDFGATHAVPAERLERIDRGRLKSVVAGIERESGGLPVLFKNGTLGFQAHFLAQVFPASIFVICRREPIWTAQSILEMRLKRFGAHDVWFGFRPPGYEELRELPWQEQIAGQITMTLKAVQAELDRIPAARIVAVDYEEFCRDPGAATLKFERAMEAAGHRLADRGPGPESFACRNERRVSNGDWNLLQQGLERFGANALRGPKA